MSDVAGAAPAAAESAPAPAPEVAETVTPPNPISTGETGGETSVGKPEKSEPEVKKAPSTREALDKAFKTVEAKQAADKKSDDTKPEAKVDTKAKEPAKAETKEPAKADNRDPETGKFTAKEGDTVLRSGSRELTGKEAEDAKAFIAASQPKPSHTAEDPPARFADTAKAKWASADPEIRGEVRRMERELTEGYQKHRAAAERDASLAEFHDMATKSGTTLRDALARYTGFETKIRENLLGGLDEVIGNASGGKLSLRDVAAHVMGQKPEELQQQSDATIRELKNEIAALKEQVGGVTQTITKQRETATLTEINAFAEKHPRFEELSEDIALFMKTGRAKDLPAAYELAERLNPAPASAAKDPPKAAEAKADTPDLAEQIRKGSKSPTGAPAAGSDPTTKVRSKTNREALDRAFARIG